MGIPYNPSHSARSLPCRGLYDPASHVHAKRAGGTGDAAVGSVASGDTAASLTWAAVIGVLVAAYLLVQRASMSLFTMTKARVNAAAHQKTQYHPGAGEARGDE